MMGLVGSVGGPGWCGSRTYFTADVHSSAGTGKNRLPAELLKSRDPKTGEEEAVVPGEFQRSDVLVGAHLAPVASELDGFMRLFEDRYRVDGYLEGQIKKTAKSRCEEHKERSNRKNQILSRGFCSSCAR